MKSRVFEYGPYTIKTYASEGCVRARLFLDGVWVREVPDWTADTVEEVVRLMQRTLDEVEKDEMETHLLH